MQVKAKTPAARNPPATRFVKLYVTRASTGKPADLLLGAGIPLLLLVTLIAPLVLVWFTFVIVVLLFVSSCSVLLYLFMGKAAGKPIKRFSWMADLYRRQRYLRSQRLVLACRTGVQSHQSEAWNDGTSSRGRNAPAPVVE
jgi:hypothetical protein